MQPLAYQIGESTCWATSIINGIMFLRKGDRIGSHQYKIMQSALNSLLRRKGVSYYTDDDFNDYANVMNLLETLFALQIHPAAGADVADAIRHLHFDGQVAICDVGNGDHSILLNGRSECGNWISAFDPWWYCDDRNDNGNVQFPEERSLANVRISMRHLLEDPFADYNNEYRTGTAYPMGVGRGVANRFLTVIESAA